MSFLYQRLGALPPLTEIEITYRLPLVLADGDEQTDDELGLADLGVMRTFFTASLETRVAALESGSGTPSNWPMARTISLAGPFTGSVSLDGSADATLTVSVPAGALSKSAISGLSTDLLGINNALDGHETRLDTLENDVANDVAASADKWTTARTLTLSGKAAGNVSMDGSADVSLNVTGLTVSKTDVGLSNVDNTSDAAKPISTATQTALNNKVALDGTGATGSWGINAATATKLATARNFSMIGVIGAANVSFDGSGNVQLTTTMVDGTLSIAKTAGLQVALDAKLDSATGIAFKANQFATARSFSMTGVVSTTAGVNFDGTAGVVLNTTMADSALSIAKTAGLQGALDGKSPTTHDHNGVYSPVAHNHDGTYVKIAQTTAVVDVNTIGGSLTHGVVAATQGNAPNTYTTTWNLGASGNRDGQFSWSYGSGTPLLYFRSRHDLSGNWNTWVSLWHSANFDPADKVNVSDVYESSQINSVVKRNSVGDMHARLYRSEYPDSGTIAGSIAYRVNNTNDNYIRYCSSNTAVRTWLGLGSASLSASTDFLPNRSSLGTVATTIADWNAAADNGWYMGSGVANAPSAAWFIGLVTQHNPNWITQEVWDFTTGASPVRYRRQKSNGTWTGWTSDINVGSVYSSGMLSASRVAAGYDAGIANSISCSQWFRSSGSTGWYNSDYAGGWYMTDTSYVRSYTNKPVVASDFVISSDRRQKRGIRDFEFKGRLRPVNYLHLDSYKPDFGFIAQEVQALYPEAVSSASGDGDILKLSYPKLTAVLSYQVNQLEDQIAIMRKQLDALSRPWWKRLLRRA